MKVENVKRNSGDFSFVDRLGSFINNMEFSDTFMNYKAQEHNKKSYIWETLSSIGEDYAETIYENVINYIDNVSNIDLCKVTALQSMIKILGVSYSVIDSYQKIPVELANLIDILSINRSYLLNSDKFCSQFKEELSDYGCIVTSTVENDISNQIVDKSTNPDGISCLSDYVIQKECIDNETYTNFLTDLYKKVINKYVFLQYADAEVGLSTDKTYIYEYIQGELAAEKENSDSEKISDHDRNVILLKTRYNIEAEFDQEQIVDDIENGFDSIDNYNQYQQEILLYEIEYRKNTYSYNKTYLDVEKSLGYNLTRYSYYREKKVREYIKFIETTYSNLLVEEEMNHYLTDEKVAIEVYEKDINYFSIDQLDDISLISYDAQDNVYEINSSYIDKIAELLATQTLEIADIREQLKLQMQKNYLRGTFLLISYVVNEFLKYNISNKYGEQFYTEDDVSLKTIMDKSLQSNDNVELIEYYDDTEYYNITNLNDNIAKNGSTTNEKFWDNTFNKIGVDTNDIPLEELDKFYLKQMKLERNQVTNIANFLSGVFEYGVNTSFINDGEDDENLGYGSRHGDFTCQLRNGKFIGDPYAVLSNIENDILSTQAISSDMQKYIDDGYEIKDTTIKDQLNDYEQFLSVYYFNLISVENEEVKQNIYDAMTSLSNQVIRYDSQVSALSAKYEELKINEKYAPYYFLEFEELTSAYLRQKLENFKLSVEIGFDWKHSELLNKLDSYLSRYNELSINLFDDIVKNQVQLTSPCEYWPSYSPNYEAELTTVTSELRDYLNSQVDVNNQGAMGHIQNHYDKLLGYRSDLNVTLQKCIKAESLLESYKDAVEAATGTSRDDDLTRSYWIWSQQVAEYKTSAKQVKTDYIEVNGKKYWNTEVETTTTQGAIKGWIKEEDLQESPAFSDNLDIETQLQNIQKRCEMKQYKIQDIRKQMMGTDGGCATQWDELNGEYATVITELTCKYVTYDVEWVSETKEKAVKTTHVQDDIWQGKYTYKDQIGYTPDGYVQPWLEHRSEEIEESILANYDEAIEELNTTVELINSELDCIGFQQITLETLERDNVHEQTSEAFNVLADRLVTLDDYIYNENKWKELTSDSQLNCYKYRLNMISWLLSGEIAKYNIRYIDSNFNTLETDVNNLTVTYKDYFADRTTFTADRLDKKIIEISNFVVETDSECSAEVSELINGMLQEHDEINANLVNFGKTMTRVEISSIDLDEYLYQEQYIPYQFHKDLSSYADAILCGDYIHSPRLIEEEYGMYGWMNGSYGRLEESIVAQIKATIPKLANYIWSTYLIERCRDRYLKVHLSSYDSMIDKIVEVQMQYEEYKAYIESQINVYNKNYEIYLKYSGMDIGYDPFYNYKNQAYSSYQIHPYLYNFIESSNVLYPLVYSFYVSFGDKYEAELLKNGIDSIIGTYGNVINLWKNGLYDWTGYRSKYQTTINTLETNPNIYYENMNFTGLFYPPALDEFVNNTQKFIQDVQDNTTDSYYYHLNLSENERNRIVNQLVEYEDAIREIAQKQKDNSIKPSLSNEYDIYKYCEDASQNSIILLKSYKELYRKNQGVENYVPSFNEKKNTPGELWIRVHNHPLAFPAFDLRDGAEEISHFNIKSVVNRKGEDINELVSIVNRHFSESEQDVKDITLDTVGMTVAGSEKQYLRCFFDMELDNTKNSLLLVVPYPTGVYSRKYSHGFRYPITFTYANSSIIIGKMISEYDSNNGRHVYSFTKDSSETGGMDDIDNPGMFASDDGSTIYTTNTNYTIKYDFIGMHNVKFSTYAIFVKKYLSNNSFTMAQRTGRISMQVYYRCYRYGTMLRGGTEYVNGLKYDIFTNKRSSDVGITNRYDSESYKYANVIASTAGNEDITLGFISNRVQDQSYQKNTSIVNYVEYSNMVEKNSELSVYGENVEYPRSTALLQTDDVEHVNIYNSFDSFVQYVVTVNFKATGFKMTQKDIRYYNLHTDMGFLPVYADRCGTTRFTYNNTLKNKNEYNVELLGPEQTDVKFTPIIITPSTENVPKGRVTEDYKDKDILTDTLNSKMYIEAQSMCTEYTWPLSNFFDTDTYLEITETGAIFQYKFTLTNTNYSQIPILKGTLSNEQCTEYYYMGQEEYDMLSGQDIIGPNNITYQGVSMTNHINNISSIQTFVRYDSIEGFPYAVTMRCNLREPFQSRKYLEEGTFMLTLYRKNTLNTYDYYHIIQNAYSSTTERYLTQDQIYDMSFSAIDSLSSFKISTETGDIYPFRNFGGIHPSQMSADLMFKYSEEEDIDVEFPYITNQDIEDDVVILDNKEQYTFFSQYDTLSSLSAVPFNTYRTCNGVKIVECVDINQNKYGTFFDSTLKLYSIYNLEPNQQTGKDEIVLYFNYRNYTSPKYVTKKADGNYRTCESTDKDLEGTYLILKPGESGKLDLRYDFVNYGLKDDESIQYHVTDLTTKIFKTYYILNVSDSKPKFILSRNPFKAEDKAEETDVYELLEQYKKGTYFRYFRMRIKAHRGGNYMSFSKLAFYSTEEDSEFEFPRGTECIKCENITEVIGHEAVKLVDGSTETYFLGTWENGAQGFSNTVNLVFDMQEKVLDIEKFDIFRWYNAPNSKSHGNFLPTVFQVDFSNDKVMWFKGNEFTNSETLPIDNSALAYGRPGKYIGILPEGKIVIEKT